MMTTKPCPDCGQQVRPCNMLRHRRRQHFPSTTYPFGKRYFPPEVRVKIQGMDRRYDEIAPRGVGPERYRIYRLRAGDLQLIATTSDAQGVGLGLITLYEEKEFVYDDSVGVLDTSTDPGHWVLNPWALGRRVGE